MSTRPGNQVEGLASPLTLSPTTLTHPALQIGTQEWLLGSAPALPLDPCPAGPAVIQSPSQGALRASWLTTLLIDSLGPHSNPRRQVPGSAPLFRWEN